MEMQTGLEGLEQQAQKGNSQIDSFLQDLENKDLIINVINNTEDFNDEFKNFLNNATPIEKIKLKKQLKECKENEENIKLVLIEHIYKDNGYNIADEDILKAISDNISTEDIKQQADDEAKDADSEAKEADSEAKKADSEAKEADSEAKEADSAEKEADSAEKEADSAEKEADSAKKEADSAEKEADYEAKEADSAEKQTLNINQETFEKVSGLKEMEEAISTRQELVKKFPDLDKKTNKKSELFQATKSELEQNGIIQQLKDSKHNERFINNYILVHTTLKELKQNENYKDVNISFFEKAVKNLDNACNIPDTKFDNFSKDNITKTRTELFDDDIGNHSLKEAKKVNEKSPTHQKKYNEIFSLNESEDTDTQLIEKYGKFIKDDKLIKLKERYQNNELSEEECNTLRQGLENTKENVDNQTKDLIEEMCLIAPIQGIFACIGPELGNNFELNKSREISNENGEVTITGHIDGIDFSLRHDTNKPNGHLQISSLLNKIDNNKFKIGEKYEDSPFELPTNGDIFNIAISCIDDGNVRNTETGPAYFEALENTIYEKFNEILYTKADCANDYIKDKIKGEKISNQCLDILGKIKGSPLSGDIEQSNSKLYNFIDLINSTNYISNTSEKKDIIKCLGTIQDIISTRGKTDKESSKYPKIIRHFLMKKKMLRRTKKILNGHDISGESIFDLFGYYTTSNSGIKTINFKQLQKDLEGKEGQESLVASMRKDEKDSKKLDDKFDNAIDNLYNDINNMA